LARQEEEQGHEHNRDSISLSRSRATHAVDGAAQSEVEQEAAEAGAELEDGRPTLEVVVVVELR